MLASYSIVTKKAKNTSEKTVYDAGVFGRTLDTNNELVLQNLNRVGQITEVTLGASESELRITVPQNQPTP